MARAVIMGGAHIADYSFYRAMEGDYVICADSGYHHAEKLGIIPDLVVGDFDSIMHELPPCINRMTYPPEKDATDFQIAFEHAIERGCTDIYAIGVFGGRVDHFLGNVSLLKLAQEKKVRLVMEDAMCMMTAVWDFIALPGGKHTYLSVIPLFEEAVVSLEGTKYPITKKRLVRGDTLGVSNEITTPEAKITIYEGSAIILLCSENPQ